ncbi:ABC transporter ATP-binding protein [Paenibacillus sp. 1001270B_150601_E10]|uniref:ABC transporter ATP-binding protein n=1 Tax=Paenibacillus sp. 1001270B_150601_E10 TaxID=2787079 RepID=UPI00189CC479|nr:ABC transporter ATP-binding protein [Paenibacillus sp. 1001270B_150601_E10]
MIQREKGRSSSDISFFEIIWKVLKMAFAAGPIYIIVNNLMAIMNGVSQGVITYMTQIFFDSVSDAVTMNTGARQVIMFAIALFLTVIVSQIINGLNNFMGMSYFKKVIGYFNQKINLKASKIHPIAYENPETLDDINKASLGATNSLGLLFTTTTIFSYYLPYFLFMFFYLYSLDPALAITLIFVFVPVALSQYIRSAVFTKLEDEIAPVRREYDYYSKSIAEKETRILGAFSYFRDLLRGSARYLNQATWRAEKKAGMLELSMSLVTLLGYVGILILFVRSLLKGNITVAAFAAVFASIDTMFGTMNAIISTHIANLTKDLGTIKNFIRFLKMPERGGVEKKKGEDHSISVSNVSFRYPNAETDSLKHVSLSIKNGETVAIVGENGSGKSTLVKLILGLYEPTEGKVMVADANTKDTSMGSLFSRTSAVFQHYQRYKLTLEENIRMSDPHAAEQAEKLEKVMENVGLDKHNRSFPDGYQTMLSREFNGVECSGGQWQRIAIARGLYRDHDIIVLDEPTAAIDPIEEMNVYQKFAEIADKKTAIIVTHRLGSAKIADHIIVMHRGEILEQGTHDELMSKGGKYQEMFHSQAKWYVIA